MKPYKRSGLYGMLVVSCIFLTIDIIFVVVGLFSQKDFMSLGRGTILLFAAGFLWAFLIWSRRLEIMLEEATKKSKVPERVTKK